MARYLLCAIAFLKTIILLEVDPVNNISRLVAAGVLAFAGSVQANIIETGTIFALGGGQGTIDSWYFNVGTASEVEISVVSPNGDPEINLFFDNGNLSLDDFIENDDDDGPGLNSYIYRFLDAGDYLLRISEWDFGNTSGTDARILADFHDSVGSTWGYTLNISGEYVSAKAVPEPLSIALFGLGLIGVGLAARKVHIK